MVGTDVVALKCVLHSDQLEYRFHENVMMSGRSEHDRFCACGNRQFGGRLRWTEVVHDQAVCVVISVQSAHRSCTGVGERRLELPQHANALAMATRDRRRHFVLSSQKRSGGGVGNLFSRQADDHAQIEVAAAPQSIFIGEGAVGQ